MVDVVLDVGLRITPDSVRSIQSEVSSAFRNISPQIDINEAAIRSQVQSALLDFRGLSATFGNVEIAGDAVARLSRFISQNVTVRFNKLEAARAAVERFRKQVEDQARITLDTQREAGAVGAEAAGRPESGLNTELVKQANQRAADEAIKLAEAEVQLQLATRQLAEIRVRESSSETRANTQSIRALRRVSDVRENLAQGIITANQALSQLRNINFNDLNALGQFAGVTLQAERQRVREIVQAKEATKRTREAAGKRNQELVKNSTALKRLTGAAARAARVELASITDAVTLAEGRRRLARALLRGRAVAQQEAAQAALNKEVAAAKKDRIKSEKEVAASNRKQAALLVKNIERRARERQQADVERQRQEGPDVFGDAISAARNRAQAQRRLNASLVQGTGAQRGFNRATQEGQSFITRFRDSIVQATKRLALYAGASQLIFGLISALAQARDEVIRLDEQSRRLVFFAQGNAFQDSISGARDFSSATEALNANFEGLLQTSIRTGLALQQTTDILVTIARVGQEVNGTFADSVTQLVRLEAGALDAETAVTSLNAIEIQFLRTLEQFNDASEDSIKLTEGISNVSAVLAATAGQSAANVQQLADATTRVGSALSQIQGLNATATIAILGEAFNATGASASRVGTTFRQLSTLIVKNAEEIKNLSGIEVLGEGGQIKGFETIIEVLERVNELRGTAGGLQLIQQIADRRNLADVQALAAGVENLRERFGDFTSTAGEQRIVLDSVSRTFEANELQSQSLNAQINRLKSTFIDLVGTPIESFFTGLVSGLQSAITFAKEFAQSVSEGFGGIDINPFTEALNATLPLLRLFGRGLLSALTQGVILAGALAKAITAILTPINFIISALEEAAAAFDRLANRAGRGTPARPEIDLAAEAQRSKEIDRQIKLSQAREKLFQEQEARRRRDASLAEQETKRIAEINNLQERAVQLEREAADESRGATRQIDARVELLKIEEKLKKLGVKDITSVTNAERRRLEIQIRLNAAKERENRITNATRNLEQLISSSLAGRAAVTIPIQFNTASIEREIDVLEKEFDRLDRKRILTFGEGGDISERVRIEREIGRVQTEIQSKQSIILANNIKIQESLLKTTTEETRRQVGLFENAGKAVVAAFSQAVGAQKSISDIFSRQGEIIRNTIQRSGDNTARFLEITGASIEQRLANIVETSSRQIAEIRRTERRRRATIGQTGDVQQAVNRVILGLERVNRTATARLFTDIRNFERDVNIVRIRGANDLARRELALRISATQRDIAIRRDAIQQEITVINQRIEAERRLNDIRINQQRDFGRLLLEAPEKFVETLRDINVAEQFFRGITQLNAEGISEITRRSAQLRGRGQTEALTRVLRGLQAAARFGREDVAPGINNAQLQSIFERAQRESPKDLLESLKQQEIELRQQTAEQKRIKELEEEMRALDREAVAIQQAQIRLSAATAAIAARQRNQLNVSIQTLIGNNAANFAALLRAREAQRAGQIRAGEAAGGLTDAQRNQIAREREIEKAAINEANRQRKDSRTVLQQLTNDNKELANETKKTTVTLGGFGRALNDILAGNILPAQRQQVQGARRAPLTTAGATALDVGGGGIFREISQSLRPLSSGTLQIVSPELVKLREAVERTGGTREQRNRLRRLEAQSRRTIGAGGSEGQGREAARRFLRDEQTAARIEQGFRNLLQDRSGGVDTQFVDELRKLRGEGARGAARVDAGAVRRLLGQQGLTGLAGEATTSRQAAGVIDRLLRLSDELTESQKNLTRTAGQEIKRILSEEITDGLKSLRDFIDIQPGGLDSVDRDIFKDELKEALEGFSIIEPNNVALLKTEIKKAFGDASEEFNRELSKAGDLLGKRIRSTLEGGELKINIPNDQQIGIDLSVNLANNISSRDFARQLATQLEAAGFGDKELRDKIVQQLQIITEPLIRRGLITASPDFVGSTTPASSSE